MNCEQVEELLSTYLDNALATEERRSVALHLQGCPHCTSILAEFRRNDALLSQMPRISPDPALRERIFSSPEYLELTGTFDSSIPTLKERALPSRSTRRDTPGRPQLVAIPGGRQKPSTPPSLPTRDEHTMLMPRIGKQRNGWGLHLMQVAIAAIVLLTIGVGGFIAHNLWLQQTNVAITGNFLTPPANPQQGPLSAGMRFVFLRDGTLWSAPTDGSSQSQRLTSTGVTVAANWAVSPPLPGRSAGDLLAYIDLQQARIHIIRSDGQRDTTLAQALLKPGVQPALVWDTEIGSTILTSLARSKDGTMLAFVADPTGSGSTSLFIYSRQTDTIQMVQHTPKGSIAHPVWSPDGVRVAFELAQNGTLGILDYNTQNQGLLTITADINHQGNAGDTILTLDWSPSTDTPAITWSVGTIGHVHSIWMHRVGVGGTAEPLALMNGDYVQATYSRKGNNGVGSWLLVASFAGRPADIWRIDVVSGANLVSLSSNKQVGFAQWSPDGTQVDYLDAISSGVGTFHVVNVITGSDTLVASTVTVEPAPAWSSNSQKVAYSTGTRLFVADLHATLTIATLKLQGSVSTFGWSASAPNQLVVALSDSQPGVYVVDILHNTAMQVDKQNINGPLEWTEIP